MSRDKQKLVPRLRFPEFEGEWPYEPLGKLASRNTRRNGSGLENRTLTNSAEFGIIDQKDFFDKDIADQDNLSNYYVVELDDFVYNPRISASAPVGPISKNRLGRGVMSPLYTVFRFNDHDSDFYAQYFETSHWHDYMRKVSSTGARHDRMSVGTDAFMGLPLPVPDLAERIKIAACLSSLDDLIAAEGQKLDALKSHKKGLMQQLFPQEGETVPRLRFPEFKGAGEWTVRTLEEVCAMQAGKFVAASEISENAEVGRYPCFGGNGLRGYTKSFTHSGRYSLIGRQGALCGNVNLVQGDFHATEHAVVATPKHGIDTGWLYFELCFLDLNQYATGQAQPGLSVEVLESIECIVPESIDEQSRIAAFLSSLDEGIAAQARKVDALKAHRKGLMQGIFPSNNMVNT